MLSDHDRYLDLVEDVEDWIIHHFDQGERCDYEFYRKTGTLRMDVWKGGEVVQSYKARLRLDLIEEEF